MSPLKKMYLGGKGNCIKRDDTNLLHILDDVCNVEGSEITLSHVALIKKYDLEERKPLDWDHDYDDMPSVMDCSALTEFTTATVSYIAGFTGRMTAKQSWCKECCDALGSSQHKAHSAFLEAKDRGGLFKPTESVILICEETERKFRRLLASTKGKLPQSRGIVNAIATSVLEDICLEKIFSDLNDHMKDTAVMDNHVFQLIKAVCKNYCKVRMYHLGKKMTASICKDKIRKKLSKLIIQKHQ